MQATTPLSPYLTRPALMLGTMLAVLLGLQLGAMGQDIRLPSASQRQDAPEFPDDFDWLNTDEPFSLAGNLKGHIIVLDFWTYACINCMHVLPDLAHIEHKYADEPVMVVGVHSAKFEAEQDPENITQAIKRYRIEHPVVVDEEHTIWNSYHARAWPTFAVIDSAGRYVGKLSGEGHRETLDQIVKQLLEEGRSEGTLAEQRVQFKPTATSSDTGGLSFPGKVTADPDGERLFIADSTNDRIIVTDAEGSVQQVIGSGKRGLKDGSLDTARFFNPQGMSYDADRQVLYVADTDNHAIRKVDLAAERVTTIAGTGEKSGDRKGGGKGTDQGLTSPWDVALHGGKLYIAMAGTHQLWVHDLETTVSERFSGPVPFREGIVDGPANSAQLAQPSGLAILDGWLYFADSETSAVRRASLEDGRVETLIGRGLFDFGYQDGPWDEALLQHVLGAAVLDGNIAVTDTYNNALRLVDLEEETIRTLLGGPDSDALDEPGGLCVLDGVIYVADTNHHRIVRFDPETGEAEPLGIEVPTEKRSGEKASE